MSNFHPAAKLTMLVCILTVTMFSSSLYIAIISFICGFLALVNVKEISSALKETALAVFVSAVMSVTNPLFSHRGATPLLFVNDRPYTLEALLYGADLGISLGAVILWFSALNKLTAKAELMYVFAKRTPRLALTVNMIMGYIPKISRRFSEISQAQKGAGIYSSAEITDRISKGAQVFAGAAADAAESSAEISFSMRTRDYGQGKRSCALAKKFTLRDIILTVWTVIFTALTLALTSAGKSSWIFYPKLEIPPQSGICACLFGLCALSPAVILTKERLKWMYLTSKI